MRDILTIKHYCYLLLPEFSNLCLFNSIEPLRAANSFIDGPGYKWSLISMDGEPVTSSSGFEMRVNSSIEQMIASENKPDVLIVMASYNYQRHSTDTVIDKLRLLKNQVKVLGGLDAGSYALAKAKLLNGYRATIHWAELDTFSEQFRQVDACNNRYVIDRNRITSGGATTALDLMLSIISLDFGKEIAIAVSDLLIFDTERSGSTPQREHVPAMIEKQTPRLARAIKLMERNIESPLTVAEIAEQTFVSQRQLERDFKKVLGNSIAGYYSRLRIMLAQRLLTETALNITEVAIRSGYSSRASFNRSYRRILGRTPSDDRRSSTS
ncbi:transcriptional regulator, AraC family with amidase-like domain [Colwellia chukchiensis]|uniref:Transcriptional regulator, AraC family with amidase-like domain n=1 Tax=Colwellia chukchiensis TaxID=641665 RepID=A0A1H7I4A6_9GAMM|nr:GlxA family transcriptional regulator [Colwellia chukchiensis]SEK55355.1 transcriptional regulator, AraC family with amidase-like domain [Colwellia chukchiensis]